MRDDRMLFAVTGGAGFIGSHIVGELIRRGHTARVIDNFLTGNRANLAPLGNGLELCEGDINDLDFLRDAFAGCRYVIHQAALVSVPRSVDDPLASHETNLTGTLNTLIAARDCGVRRVVLASSSAVYGDADAAVKSEDLCPAPLSPYALTKLASETYARLFHDLYGLETVCLRYFNVFGPRQDPNSAYAAVIPRFVTVMLNAETPVIFGDGTQTRDFTFVSNVVDANLHACTCADGAGEVFNIACGESISLLDLVDAINGTLGTRIAPDFAPERPGDIKHSRADITKAKEVLGYEPEVGFDEGLRRTIEWYQSNG